MNAERTDAERHRRRLGLDRPQSADHQDEHGEADDIQQHLQAAGPAVVQHPRQQLPIPAHSCQRAVCPAWYFRCSIRDHVGDGFQPQRNDRGVAGTGNTRCGKTEVAEDPEIIEYQVDDRVKGIHPHHDRRLAAAAVKCGPGLGDEHARHSPSKGCGKYSISNCCTTCACSTRPKTVAASGASSNVTRAECQGNPDRLPDRRTDLVILAIPKVLRDKRIGVGADAQRQTQQGEPHHRGGEGRRHGLPRNPLEEHPVDKRHDRPGQAGDHQRERDLQDLSTAGRLPPPV